MRFRAILFDIGDTLWYAKDPPTPQEFRRMGAERAGEALRELGVAHPDPAAVARTAWVAMEEAMRRARCGDLVEPDYAAVSQAALRTLGLDLSLVDAGRLLEATYISGIEGGKAPFPDSRAVLDELRARKFLIAAVTNRAFGGERFRSDLRDAGLDVGWDAEAVSVEVGYLKPHRAIFDYALGHLGVGPGEALMVGNSLAEDVAGAQRLGIAAAWRKSRPDADDVTPEFTFGELTELLALPELGATA